jgi:hypothetical protein
VRVSDRREGGETQYVEGDIDMGVATLMTVADWNAEIPQEYRDLLDRTFNHVNPFRWNNE